MALRAGPVVDFESDAKAAMEGDRAATDRLLAAIQPRVIRYCRARIPSRRGYMTADDVAQEALLAVFRGLPSCRKIGAGFMAYVYGIVSNKVVDYHRKQQREIAIAVEEIPDRSDADGGPEQAVLQAEMRRKVRDLLSTLPEAHQEILVHRVIGGMTSEEVARLIPFTPGAVRVIQHRALEKLRRQFVARP